MGGTFDFDTDLDSWRLLENQTSKAHPFATLLAKSVPLDFGSYRQQHANQIKRPERMVNYPKRCRSDSE